ncbi:uncharacterized protein [Dermacentor andersoni]|uniref:uncharacterized protein isoform X1 n=1 Tax=Dermacentor andersoni TaxID=34620 RepID=UPI003B3B2F84
MPAGGPNVCAHVGCRDCSVSHHGMLADSPALRVVIFVRALLWHPRPSLAQTTAVVRRTVRRQLALMYAHTWAVGIVPCHTTVCWQTAQHCAWSTSCTRWLPEFLHVTPWQAGLQTSTIRGKPRARSTVASTAVACTDGRRRTKDRTSAAGPNVCAHVCCRDCSMSHRGMPAAIRALHVGNFVEVRAVPDVTSVPFWAAAHHASHARSTVTSTAVTWPDNRRRTKGRTPAAGPNVCAHVGCRDCSTSHHGMLADSPALRVVNFVEVGAVLDVTSDPIWAAGDRGSHARSTVASTAVISPDGRRRTKDRTPAAGPNVCAHVGSRDCSMSHHTMLADSPALRVVIFVAELQFGAVCSAAYCGIHGRHLTGPPTSYEVTVCSTLYCGIHSVSGLTADVVRRSICRQLALVYAPTWAVGIAPCHTGLLGDCPTFHLVPIVERWLFGCFHVVPPAVRPRDTRRRQRRGILHSFGCRDPSKRSGGTATEGRVFISGTSGSIHHSLHKMQAPFSMWLLVPPRREVEFRVGCAVYCGIHGGHVTGPRTSYEGPYVGSWPMRTRWLPGFLHVTPWTACPALHLINFMEPAAQFSMSGVTAPHSTTLRGNVQYALNNLKMWRTVHIVCLLNLEIGFGASRSPLELCA